MKIFLWVVIAIIVIALLSALAFGLQDDEAAMPMAPTTPITEVETTSLDNLAQVRAQAVTDLTALRARVQAGESYESLVDDYAMIRARVTASYAIAGAMASDEWQGIQAGFESFEASARAGSSAALDSFADLIVRLSADVGTDASVE